ncbi:MAG: hypothetical protein M1821_003116 [Bathelium mastoideum]|nr:MAG: hypothetical protein M1821_003116 [Bathelium mastoideum]
MPHTNRQRRKKPEWDKARVVTTSDGWSTVISTRAKPVKELFQDHNSGPKPVDPDVTVEVLDKDFLKAKSRWQQSQGVQTLQRVAESRRNLKIDKAICFGLGSMSCSQAVRSTHLLQLAAFTDMASLLQSTGKPIQLYLQDPAFNHVDVEFLQYLGIHVIDSEEGFAQITKDTCVFLPFTPWTVVLKHAENISVSPLIIAPNLSKMHRLLKYVETMDINTTQAQLIASNRRVINFTTGQNFRYAFEDMKIYMLGDEDEDHPSISSNNDLTPD